MSIVDWSSYSESFIPMEDKTGVLTSVHKLGGHTVIPDVPAVRGAVTNEMLAETDGAAVRPSASYQIRLDALATSPKPGDIWTEGGVDYRVQVVLTDDAFYLIGVYDPSIAFALADFVDFMEKVEGRTSMKTRRTTEMPYLSGLQCRIQPESAEFAIEHDRAGTREVFSIYLDQTVTLLPDRHIARFAHPITDTLTDADIVSIENQQQIGTLTVVVVEARP